MRTHISFNHLEQATHASLDNQIRVLASRHIHQYVQRFDQETVELRINLDKTGDRDFYSVRIQLVLPGATLPVTEEGFDLGRLLNLAFDQLEREVAHHMSRSQNG